MGYRSRAILALAFVAGLAGPFPPVLTGRSGAGLCRAAENAQEDRARELAAALGAEDWARRENAQKELLRLGGAALPALRDAAKSGDAEVRARAAKLLEAVTAIVNLESPDRGTRVAAALDVNQLAEEAAAADRPGDALELYRKALPANPDLLDSSYVRGLVAQAAGKLPEPERTAFGQSDLGLYLARKFGDLRKEFPASYLSGKAVYAGGGFEEYLRLFPSGFYAPPAKYCLIAGYKAYALPEDRLRPVRIADPDREIREWPQFLKDFPDFEGADDANYRLARALEIRGRLQEACLRLRLRLGDGDMEENALERLLFIMDARMDTKTLAALGEALGKEAEPPKDPLIANPEVSALASYLAALKLLRDGSFKEAAQAFEAVSRLEPAPAPEPAGDEKKPAVAGDAPEAGGDPVAGAVEVEGEDAGEGDDEGLEQEPLLAALPELAAARAGFATEAARLAAAGDAGALRDLAGLMCAEKSQYVFMTGLDWGGSLAISSYGEATEPAESHRRRSRFWQAARVCERLVKDHPKAPEAADAVYTLALCHCRMAETHWVEHRTAYWRSVQKENVKKSIDWYVRFARDYPDDPRAAEARRASERLTEAWFPREGGER